MSHLVTGDPDRRTRPVTHLQKLCGNVIHILLGGSDGLTGVHSNAFHLATPVSLSHEMGVQ
jgi:hypothetical protein